MTHIPHDRVLAVTDKLHAIASFVRPDREFGLRRFKRRKAREQDNQFAPLKF
jgi:hypothetical protein